MVAALFAAVFWPNLRRLWLKTNPFTGEANWSHSIFVPLIGLYYLFINREELIRAGASDFIWGKIFRPGRLVVAGVMAVVGSVVYFLSASQGGLIFSIAAEVGSALAVLGILVLILDWSLAIILFGLGVYVYGIYPGQNDYTKDLGMVITLFGIVLMLNGWKSMKIAWFPVVFLVCAIPWPMLVYSWVAEPLSHMAAHFAVDVLKLSGVDGQWSGSKIIIYGQIGQPPRVLNVEEACAGMKSLMTFIAVAGAIAFLPPRPLWQRIIIVVSAVPIAIFCNMMRISVTGLLDHYVSTKWSDSFAHQFVGIIMLLPAFFLILIVANVLEKIFIVEAEENENVVVRSSIRPAAVVSGAPASAPAVASQKHSVAQLKTTPAPKAPTEQSVLPRPAAAPVRTTAPVPATQRPAVIPPRPATASTPPRPATILPRPAMANAPRAGTASVGASTTGPATTGAATTGAATGVTGVNGASVPNRPAGVSPAPTVRPVGAPARKPLAPPAYKPVDSAAGNASNSVNPDAQPSAAKETK